MSKFRICKNSSTEIPTWKITKEKFDGGEKKLLKTFMLLSFDIFLIVYNFQVWKFRRHPWANEHYWRRHWKDGSWTWIFWSSCWTKQQVCHETMGSRSSRNVVDGWLQWLEQVSVPIWKERIRKVGIDTRSKFSRRMCHTSLVKDQIGKIKAILLAYLDKVLESRESKPTLKIQKTFPWNHQLNQSNLL